MSSSAVAQLSCESCAGADCAGKAGAEGDGIGSVAGSGADNAGGGESAAAVSSVFIWFVSLVVKALPCHGRDHGFKSHTNRNKYLCTLMHKYSPAMLRENFLCYGSHKKSPEKYRQMSVGSAIILLYKRKR